MADRCERCQVEYPPGCVAGFYVGAHSRLCGQCALALKNEIHGTADTVLVDPTSEKMRVNALRFLIGEQEARNG